MAEKEQKPPILFEYATDIQRSTVNNKIFGGVIGIRRLNLIVF